MYGGGGGGRGGPGKMSSIKIKQRKWAESHHSFPSEDVLGPLAGDDTGTGRQPLDTCGTHEDSVGRTFNLVQPEHLFCLRLMQPFSFNFGIMLCEPWRVTWLESCLLVFDSIHRSCGHWKRQTDLVFERLVV